MNAYIRRLDRFIERTLSKAQAVNKPYQAIKRLDAYKELQAKLQEGINKQGAWVAEQLPDLFSSAGIEDDSQEITVEQAQKLRGQLTRDMPMLSDYVTEFVIFQNLKDFFEWSVRQQYKRWGYLVKASVNFTLSNTQYINALKDRAAYLLNQSSLDATTIDGIISIMSESKLDGQTNAQIGQTLKDRFDEISSARAEMITRTESANALGSANHAAAVENGAGTKLWVAAGGASDELCLGNVDDGEIPINQPFSSGDMYEPAHPNCECYTEAGEIDLDAIDLWDGS